MPAVFWPIAFMAIVFTIHGVNMPYMPVWYEKVRHLSGPQIGAMFSAALLARVVTGPVISAWVEGQTDPRKGYMLLAFGLTGSTILAAWAPNYATLVVAAFLIQNCLSSLIPYAESSALIATRTGSISYGQARGMGSSAFVVASLLMGVLIARFGPWAAWTWLTLVAILVGLTLFKMPPPLPHAGPRQGFRTRLKEMREFLRNPAFLRITFGAAFIQGGHAFFYNFGTLTWLKQGIPSELIGFLWAAGVLTEITFLLLSQRLLRGRDYEWLLILGGVLGMVRWCLSSLSPPYWGWALIQMLHAGSFAMTHFATMQMLDRIAGDRLPVAQTLYFSLGSGAFTGLATLVAGYLYQNYGAKGYAAMAVMCLIGVTIVLSHKLRNRNAAAA